jgi:hypothetical protein
MPGMTDYGCKTGERTGDSELVGLVVCTDPAAVDEGLPLS